jgi:hypothetical protein
MSMMSVWLRVTGRTITDTVAMVVDVDELETIISKTTSIGLLSM